jgi:hypothetical protein
VAARGRQICKWEEGEFFRHTTQIPSIIHPPSSLGSQHPPTIIITTITMNRIQAIKPENQRQEIILNSNSNSNNNDLDVHYPWNKYLADDDSISITNSTTNTTNTTVEHIPLPPDIHPFTPNAKRMARQQQAQQQLYSPSPYSPSPTFGHHLLTPREQTSDDQEADLQNRIFHMKSLLGDFNGVRL